MNQDKETEGLRSTGNNREKRNGSGPFVARFKKRWGIFATLLLAIGLANGYMFAQTSSTERSFFGIPISPFKAGHAVRLGAIHGVRLSIPAQYIFFPVEYEGEDSWKPSKNKPERTPDSEIRAFSIYVQWPELKPRNRENEASFQASFKTLKDHDWLMMALHPIARKAPSVAAQWSEYSATGDALTLQLRRFDVGHVLRERVATDGVHFVIEHDARLGLNVATPVGSGTDKRISWNDQLYWLGPQSKTTNTFIECRNRKTTTSENPGGCTHQFEIPELNAMASVTYKAGLLPEWQQIQAKARRLFLSFRVSEQSQSNSDPKE